MRKKSYDALYKTYYESYQAESQTIIPQVLANQFLDAASSGDITLMRTLLSTRKITVASVTNPEPSYAFLGGSSFRLARRPVVDIALYRLKNNLSGLRMLLEEFEVPLRPDFLNSVENKQVAKYLMEVHGLDPYEKARRMERRSDDGDCPYFSAKNVQRLHHQQYRFLRSDDHKAIGDTLNQLTNVLITGVESGHVYRLTDNKEVLAAAPHIRCASPADAIILAKFLENQCGLLDVYQVVGCELFSRERLPKDTCDHSNFIMAVGKKAGIYEELPEEKHQANQQLTMQKSKPGGCSQSSGPRHQNTRNKYLVVLLLEYKHIIFQISV